jgi:hypothetical protein
LRPSRASVFVRAADQETGPAAAEAEHLESVRRRTPRRKGGTAPAKKRGAALSGKKYGLFTPPSGWRTNLKQARFSGGTYI